MGNTITQAYTLTQTNTVIKTNTIAWSNTNTIMPYGLKPENVLCANTIALALAKRLVGSTKHENHQNYVQQCIKINSSKHHSRLLCTATFDCSIHTTQPNLYIQHWKKNNFQNVCILHYIGHLSFNPDFCANFLKRCIINKEKYRNTDAFVLLEWMGEGETPISRMCVQPNICHSILIFVPNIWGP